VPQNLHGTVYVKITWYYHLILSVCTFCVCACVFMKGRAREGGSTIFTHSTERNTQRKMERVSERERKIGQIK